jgi:hypothetical protein
MREGLFNRRCVYVFLSRDTMALSCLVVTLQRCTQLNPRATP